MAMADAEPARLDIGRVIQDLIALMQKNFPTFLVLAAILSGIPALLMGLVDLGLGPEPGLVGGVQMFLLGLVRLVSALVLQGALIYGTVADMNGRPVSVRDCISVGLRNFLPLFGIAILIGLAVTFGLILLVIPGVIIAVVWSVAVPAFVAERLDVFASFGRSAELTRGSRWRIFGLFLIYALVIILVSAVLGILGMFGPAVRAVIVQPAAAVISGMIGATLTAVLYVELRRLREGVGPETLTAIFD